MSTGRTLERAFGDVGELLSRSVSGLSRVELHAYRGRFPDFCRDLFRIKLTPQQIEAGRALEAGETPQVLVQGGQGVGKDTLLACWSMFEVYVWDALALLSAPVERSVREVTMRREIGRLWSRAAGKLEGERYEMAIRIPGREPTGLLAFTASDPEKFVGHHAPRVFIGLTEGQAIPDGIFEAAQRCQPDTLLVICNPVSPSCAAYGLSRSAAWETLVWSCLDHPNVLEDQEVVPGAVSSGWVDRMRQEKGKDSRFWRYAVLGEFPEEAEDAAFKHDDHDRAEDLYRDGAFEAEERHTRLVCAVDVAGTGMDPDRSCLCVRRGKIVEAFHTWKGLDTREIATRVRHVVAELCESTNGVKTVLVDTVGPGGPGVYDRLREELREVRYWYIRPGRTAREASPNVVEFKASRKAEDPDRYANLKAQTFHRLRRELQEGRLALPPTEGLREELLAHRLRHRADGRVEVGPKDAVRARIGRSPDLADSLTMTMRPMLESAEGFRIRFSGQTGRRTA